MIRITPAITIPAALMLALPAAAAADVQPLPGSAVPAAAISIAGVATMIWSAPIAVAPGEWLTDVSCPSAVQCTGVDDSGHQVTFNPTAPGTPTPTTIDSGHRLTGVSCPSTSQCTAVGGGRQVTFNPTAPGTPTATQIAATLDAVACPTTSQCTGIFSSVSGGQQLTFNPNTSAQTGWRILTGSAYALNGGVACPSTSQCTAVGGGGRVVTFDPTGGIITSTALDAEWLEGVACPSTGQCTAVGHPGPVFEGDPNTPTSWHVEPIAGTWSIDDVDCSSIMQCVAVSGPSAFLGTRAFTLTVTVTGSGTVAGSGITCPGACSKLIPTGTAVALTAAANPGSGFAGWSGGGCSGSGGCTVTMSADQSVAATFTATPVTPTPPVTPGPTVTPQPTSTPGAVQQTATVRVPKQIAYTGRTVLLKKALLTNAGQKAAAKVTVSPKGTKYSKVTTKPNGKVTITTFGRKKLRVTLTLTAAATGAYGPYGFTKKWTVRK